MFSIFGCVGSLITSIYTSGGSVANIPYSNYLLSFNNIRVVECLLNIKLGTDLNRVRYTLRRTEHRNKVI